MNQDSVMLLFGLFAGPEVVPEEYQGVVEMAMEEVLDRLRDEADADSPRLNYLAAAVANLRYAEVTCARDKAAYTYAGGVAQNTNSRQKLESARILVRAYQGLCRELLKDETFYFIAV